MKHFIKEIINTWFVDNPDWKPEFRMQSALSYQRAFF